MNTQMLHDSLQLAFQNRLTFPETVQRMAADGIERYHADLVRLEKTHYAGAQSHIERIPLDPAPAIAREFQAGAVKQAIEDIRAKSIDYPEFLRRIMHAGASEYTVFLNGRKAVYTGINGENYVEPFPSQPAGRTN